MLILNKPAGIPVHAGPKGGPNMEDYFPDLQFGLPNPPGLAHRLDRDTSGCLILGRHRQALRKLGNLFMQGQITKTYWAVVEGIPAEPKGTIDKPLRKKTSDTRSWWMEIHEEGQHAVTDYEVLGSADGISWLALYPKTGRTHQIRVHLASLGCPIIGDPVYGNKEMNLTRKGPPMQLHARAVKVPLYEKKEPILTEAPPPEYMQVFLNACGYKAA